MHTIFKRYIRSGLIVQDKGDKYNAIDSCFLTCNYYYQSYVAGVDQKGVLNKCYEFLINGKVVRYPHNESFDVESRIWNDHRTVSRDNAMGLLCVLTELKDKKAARIIAKDILSRKSFFQNIRNVKGEKNTPDYCIAEWAIVLRGAFPSKWMYPVFAVLDCLMVLNSVVYVLHCRYDKKYNSPLFHMISQVLCITRNFPTLPGRIAKWILFSWTPHSPGFSHENALVSQIMEYSRMDYDPPVYKIVEKLCDQK